jgi:DNA-binding SARP family transcriptional activator
MAVAFRLLGPVEMCVDGRRVPLTAKQRALLAVLLTSPNAAVSVEHITDALWDDDPPASAAARVRALVAELRRAIGPSGPEIVLTRNPGYLVVVGPGELDTESSASLVEEAETAWKGSRWEEAVDAYGRALALWRGAPLADVRSRFADSAAHRLGEQRLTALESRADAMLALHRYSQVVYDMQSLADEEPLRETPRGRLMTALWRSGRTAEALKTYRDFRSYLVVELGLEPTEPLRRLHETILAGDGAGDGAGDVRGSRRRAAGSGAGRGTREPSAPVPRQLPASTRRLVGRRAELADLDELADGPARTVLVVGAAGTGKTSLAVHWARQAAERFPDGHLFLAMKGFDRGEPMTTAEALPLLLRGLGRPTEEIPYTFDEQLQLYRSLLAERRVLLLFDDVAAPQQVRPLLPGTQGCFALVTSRDRLRGLVALDDAGRLTLDVLTPRQALDLLRQVVGDSRVGEDPASAVRLAEQCGYLPLALSVAAARLADQPHRALGRYVAELEHRGRLARLSIDGDENAAVRAALDLSYQALDPEARRMFRLLGLPPKGGLSTAAAAALAGVRPVEAEDLLDAAARVHLVVSCAADRHDCHDLVREFAAEQAAEDGPGVRDGAILRLFDYYLRSVVEVTRSSALDQMAVPYEPPPDAVPPETFDDETRAMRWLDSVWEDITAAVALAAEHGPRRMAWLLTDAMQDLFMRRPLSEWKRLTELALDAAVAEQDIVGQAAMHLARGRVYWRMTDLSRARRHYERAEELARAAGWRKAQSSALRGAGVAIKQAGEPRKALPRYLASIAVDREIGDVRAEAVGLNNLASAYLTLAELGRAEDSLTRALPLARETGNRHMQALVLVNLGLVRQKRGSLDGALEVLEEATKVARDAHFTYADAVVWETLGRVHNDACRYQQAIEVNTLALRTAEKVENRNCQVDALAGLALSETAQGRVDAAFAHIEAARAITEQTGHRSGLIDVLISAAEAHRRAGRPGLALQEARHALQFTREGHALGLGRSHLAVAAALLDQGESAEAGAECERGLRACEESGQRLVRARLLLTLGHAYRCEGRETQARTAWASAHAAFTEIGTPESAQTAALLG